jgi:hypothetical protein
MQRQLQAQIHEETRGMSREEFVKHIQGRIRTSRFAAFLEREVGAAPSTTRDTGSE